LVAPAKIAGVWIPRSFDEVVNVLGSATETGQLDFKEELGRNQEVAKDIAAMTIDGGVLLYGIHETNRGIGDKLAPIAVSGTPERIQQIAASSIRPVPVIETHVLTEAHGDPAGLIVVVVPPSPLVPHMANDRYPARSGTTTRYLSEPEVERFYMQRESLTREAEQRLPLAGFYASEGGWPGASAIGNLSTLSIFVRPIVPQPHPHAPYLEEILQKAAAESQQVVKKFVTPELEPALLVNLETWEPLRTFGWKAGKGPDSTMDLSTLRNLGLLCWAAFSYTTAAFSFEITMVVVDEKGTRYAYEHIWARETMGALAFVGSFFRDVPGVSFVDVDLQLSGLQHAITIKAVTGAYVRSVREIEDPAYQESRRMSVAEIEADPRAATHALLDRLFASYLGNADVIAELESAV